jgi:hypothetical protein
MLEKIPKMDISTKYLNGKKHEVLMKNSPHHIDNCKNLHKNMRGQITLYEL